MAEKKKHPGFNQYRVKYRVTILVETVVDARSEEEAAELAEEIFNDDPYDVIQDFADAINFTTTLIERVPTEEPHPDDAR